MKKIKCRRNLNVEDFYVNSDTHKQRKQKYFDQFPLKDTWPPPAILLH